MNAEIAPITNSIAANGVRTIIATPAGVGPKGLVGPPRDARVAKLDRPTMTLTTVIGFFMNSSLRYFAQRFRSATTPAGAGRAQARLVTAGVVVL